MDVIWAPYVWNAKFLPGDDSLNDSHGESTSKFLKKTSEKGLWFNDSEKLIFQAAIYQSPGVNPLSNFKLSFHGWISEDGWLSDRRSCPST